MSIEMMPQATVSGNLSRMDTRTHPPALDNATAAFIQHFVSINAGGRDALGWPVVSRAYGCRVSPDRGQVTVFFHPPRSEALLRAVRENGLIAVVFVRPGTHESLQLKGGDACIVALEPGDAEAIARSRLTFSDDLKDLGFRPDFCDAVSGMACDDWVGVRFTPDAAFDQTPGQYAGRPLEVAP